MKNEDEAERIFNFMLYIGQWSAPLLEFFMEAFWSRTEWWTTPSD
jgi:hypothetical protein